MLPLLSATEDVLFNDSEAVGVDAVGTVSVSVAGATLIRSHIVGIGQGRIGSTARRDIRRGNGVGVITRHATRRRTDRQVRNRAAQAG